MVVLASAPAVSLLAFAVAWVDALFVVLAALAVAAVEILVPESAVVFVQQSLARPEPGLVVILSWSASQLVRRNMALEEKSFLLCIPAPLSWAQRFHDTDEKLTLLRAAELAAWCLTVSDFEAFL